MTITEEWKPIVDDRHDFTGLYEVSSLGRVRNSLTEAVMSPNLTPGGYLMVQLHRDGRRYPKMISRLVAFAFVDNPNPKLKIQVNHLSEDKNDNRACNLEWVTPKENANYGTRNARCTENRPKCRVNQIDLKTGEIIATYPSIRGASRETGINNIFAVMKGKYKHAGGYGWEYADVRS